MIIRFVKSRVFLCIAFLTLFLSFHIKLPIVLASDNASKSDRFEIISQDGQNINISDMAPGDIYTKKYTLRNKSSDSTDVLLDFKKISSSKSDLFNQLNLTVIYDGSEIYHGIMSQFKGMKLSQIPGNSEKLLEIIQELPGEETGNEFQNSVLETEFIFTLGDASKVLSMITPNNNNSTSSANNSAISNNILPKTGSASHTVFWVVGSTFIGIGLFVRNKRRWI